MNTKYVVPETITAGFVLFLVIVLFVLLRMTDGELSFIFKYLYSISGGATVILVSITVGFSFILGTLSHRTGKDLSNLYYKIRRKIPPQINPPNEANETQIVEYYNKWLAKSLYRTLMLSGPFIVLELIMLDNRLSSGNHFMTIIQIGLVLEAIFIISFITQRKESISNS